MLPAAWILAQALREREPQGWSTVIPGKREQGLGRKEVALASSVISKRGRALLLKYFVTVTFSGGFSAKH